MLILLLCVAFAIGFTACGRDGDGVGEGALDDGPGGQKTGTLVYEPEALELTGGGEFNLYNVQFLGDMFCAQVYLEDPETGGSYVLRCQSLLDDTVTDIPMDGFASVWTLGEDGSLYTVGTEVSGGEDGGNFHLDRFLVKQTRQGEQVFRQDITELLDVDEFSMIRIAVDAEGRTYLLTEGGMFLFDGKGSPNGTVRLELSGSISFCSFGRGSDGKVYITDGISSATLYEVDYTAGKLGAGYPGFRAMDGNSLSWDADGNYLTVDGGGVYRYNMETHEQEMVFELADADIAGSMLSATVGGLSDGRIAVAWQDWDTRNGGVVLMAGTNAPELAEEQKQELVLGVLRSNSFLKETVAEFNKKNEAYKITIKTYMLDGDVYLNDGAERLMTDIGAGNCPDIIGVSSVMDWQSLVEKGVFEDLAPYLEQGGTLSRESFFENVLDAYTHEGVLAAIPSVIQIQAFFGSAEELGEVSGWTIEDVIAFSDAHPGAELFEGASGIAVMGFCLSYSMDNFVDWERGTCSFDGAEFKRLLEFAARFPSGQDAAGGSYQKSWRDKARDGELLLQYVDMYELNDIQWYGDPFQDVAAVGYPTPDGSPAYTLYGTDSLGISARSEAKEAAWDFIVNYLLRDGRRSVRGFSTIREKFDEMVDEETGHILLDNNGDPVLDEFGNYLPPINSTREMQDGSVFTYRIPNQEEIDMVIHMIDTGRLEIYHSTRLLAIIYEEADAFFRGQRIVDEVADIIQRRAEIYVSEKS